MTQGRELGQATFAYYATVLLDVLSQRFALQGLKDLPESPEDQQRFLDAARAAVGTVLQFRKDFEDFFEAAEFVPEEAEQLPPPLRQEYDRLRTTQFTVRHFSDLTTVSVCLGDRPPIPIVSLSRVLTAAATVVLTQMQRRRVCRGGIELGGGIMMPHGDIYGWSLAAAYQLESEVAKWPRVVIGNELIDYLVTEETIDLREPDAKVRRAFARKCWSMVTADADGCYILDYLGSGFRAIVQPENQDWLREGVAAAYQFIVSEHERFQAAEDTKLAERYQALREYYEARLHLWAAT